MASRSFRWVPVLALLLVAGPARTMDLKSMGIDLERTASILLPMLPVICNANKEQKQNVDCAGCVDSMVQYFRALSHGEEWAILSECAPIAFSEMDYSISTRCMPAIYSHIDASH